MEIYIRKGKYIEGKYIMAGDMLHIEGVIPKTWIEKTVEKGGKK